MRLFLNFYVHSFAIYPLAFFSPVTYSEIWQGLTEDVQQLVTADSGMIKLICGVSLKDRIPATDLLLCLCLSSINDMLC